MQKFNGEKHVVDGKQVFVAGKIVSSGDAQKQISKGQLQPTVWSPSSSFWGRLANLQTDTGVVANDNPSIVRTPLVIAMWKPMAQALGWPRKQVSFKQIIKLATASNGWASVGAQFGPFKYVHTNPDFSTSGAEAVADSYYAFAGKREGLTNADVARAAPSVKQVEKSIVHYGDNTLFIEDQLKKHGQGYASAVAMEETTLLDFNRTQPAGSPKLVALYPSEGTFVSDDPFMILNGSWVSAAQRTGAEQFHKFLASEITPALAGQYGFRPGSDRAKPAGMVSTASGADPSQPKIELKVPEPKVLNSVLTTWRRDRKPANVLLVLDNSGSMGDENKLEHAKQGLRGFLANAAPQDRIGLMKFSARPQLLVPIAPFAANRTKLRSAVDQLFPEDDTALFQATAQGLDVVKQEADTSRINAVVLLTDGQDTAGGVSESQLLSRLEDEGRAETGGVRLYTIAYGTDADKDLLARFSNATGGKPFEGDNSNIDSVYLSISSFF
ncbi:MAG: Ca-activated chloride channel [Thermoleophilaceae bacterium]|nr:Ca-activated chloride channel [Thermoleophilaceae bacterium]